MRQSLLVSNELSIETHQAIRHVSHVLDLCNNRSDLLSINSRSASGISTFQLDQNQKVAIKSIEGILRRFLSLQRDSTNCRIHSHTLDELLDLICQCSNYRIIPSLSCLETMWTLQQEVHENQMVEQSERYLRKKLSRKHVGRSIRLLNNWIQWSQKKTSNLKLPNPEYVACVFRAAKEIGMSMTTNMWALYQQQYTIQPEVIPLDQFSTVLSILSESPSCWKEKQVLVLKQVEGIFRARNDSSVSQWIPELETALEAASAAGLSHDATWLYNLLNDNHCSDGPKLQRYLELWIQSIYNDNDMEGSLLYLENVLLRSDSNILSRLRDRRFYNKYLEKLSRSGMVDAGERAEVFFMEWQHQAELFVSSTRDEWCPDKESIRYVALAYLQSDSSREAQLSAVRRFLLKHQIEQ
ncbi:hypothetical protein IV203_001788 [Nitzschia inconspicua]|uniref:Uncharacterized protein n=1 Tax=Nitzschia inconspicua TaxID=303405 RepID=A0A9K3PRC8_9STRA|nr:hypothetical protein IV203_001788 [Nitzschia inconspicua]